MNRDARIVTASTRSPTPPLDYVVRSLFPLAALALIASVPFVGPWPVAAATFVWWRAVTWLA